MMVLDRVLGFLLCCFSYVIPEIQAMITLEVPDPFPGHSSTPIQHKISVPNTFHPEDYQQEKLKNEKACNFNSLMAGIMHTPYGRKKIQNILKVKNESYIEFCFYFPSKDFLRHLTKDRHKEGNEA